MLHMALLGLAYKVTVLSHMLWHGSWPCRASQCICTCVHERIHCVCLQHFGRLPPWPFEVLHLPSLWLPPPQPDHEPPDEGEDTRDKEKIKKVCQAT